MKARILALSALAVWAAASVPDNAHAADVPIKVLEPPREQYVGGDPWVPDGRDPRRIIQAPDQGVVDESAVTREQVKIHRAHLWMQRIARILRALPGGWIR